jgi:hydroxypyruvate reductase
MRRAISIPELRPLAESIWRTALDAARPGTCLSAAIRIGGAGFAVGRTEIPLRGRLVVVGAGKAAASMAQEVERIFGDRIRAGRVITKYGHGLRTARIEVLEAGHPVPDEAGAAAVERMRELLGGLASEDVVLCLICG